MNTFPEFSDYLATIGDSLGEFVPTPFYSEVGDFLDIVITNEETFSERIDETVTIHRSLATNKLVGCTIKGVSLILRNLFQIVSVEGDGVRFDFLFIGAVAAKETQHQEAVEAYREIIDTFREQIIPRDILPNRGLASPSRTCQA